jgi:DNA-binding transcriptional regulator YiaG
MKKMRLKYKSKIMEAIHEYALGLFEVGAITEEEMREFDRACLVQDEPQPAPKAVRPAKRALASV